MKSHSLWLPLVLAPLLFPAAPAAAQVSPNLYSGMRWRMIGPFRAGRATAVAGVPGDPSTYYFGTAGGGVWKTTDGGAVWKPIFDQAGVASIGALALAPSNPRIIYVGTGENSVYSGMSHGDGVYKSSDGGATWQHLGLDDSRHIGRILVDPRNPELVLVAAMGHSYAPSAERGVFRSTDGGHTWKKVLYKDENAGAVDLCFEPGNPRVVYATLWHAIRRPGQRGTSYGPGSGLYKSSDEGASWTEISGHGLPAGDWGRAGVAVAAGGKRVYLILEAKKDSGLYRSDDAGATWLRSTQDERIRGVWFFSEITADPRNPDVVYVPETSVYRSADGGKTFVSLKGAPGGDDYHAVWVDPENSRRIFLGVDQGATFSLDGGESWSTWYNQPTAQFYHVATDHRWPYWVYGPQQDSGTMAVASRGDYGQITERDWYPVGPGESGYTIPDAADPDLVWNAGPGGSLVRFARSTGQVQDVSPAPVLLGSKLRFNWSMPLAFSPQDPHVLYLGTQFLLKTADNGMSWQTLSPDLTRSALSPEEEKKQEEEEKKLPPDKRKFRGTLTTVAPSPVRASVIWTGSNDGYVQVTQDGGATWQNVTPAEVSAWSGIDQVEASHFQAGTAYVAVSRNDLDDLKPYIYRTRDYGKGWQMVAGGIGAADYVHSVREDPVRAGLLYAATEGGVYVSFDDGEHWQSLTLNLPPVRASDLAVEQDDLVASTYGRSFWILDDVTPLRQAEAGAAGEARLFAPRAAVRVRRDENQD
ncbi:MAG TPA: hypothetical protein VE825_17815, partial [Terriglobales bacterium]|nr:hypothetical protein [Terriglobales bacterium]